jgi:release factor glutamine methyltransferase
MNRLLIEQRVPEHRFQSAPHPKGIAIPDAFDVGCFYLRGSTDLCPAAAGHPSQPAPVLKDRVPWTPLAVLSWTQSRFAERGLPSARLDAEVLLAHALRTTRVALYTGFDKPLEETELATYRELIKRRLAGEPVAYLVGEQEFWSLPLAVDARVLIPRRDTETLVEVALAALARGRAARVADIATGSGAVALALAKERPEAVVVATDVSPDALAVARANAARHALDARVAFKEGDLAGPLDGAFDLIVSNPPYVPSGTIAGLAPEVRREPRLALDGGADGLDLVRRLVPAAVAHLAEGATLAIEHGFDQGEAVRALLSAAGLDAVATQADLAGQPRVTSGRRALAPRPGAV